MGARGHDIPDLPARLLRRGADQRPHRPGPASPREDSRVLRLLRGARRDHPSVLAAVRERHPRLRHGGLLPDRPPAGRRRAHEGDRGRAQGARHPRGARRRLQPHGPVAQGLPGPAEERRAFGVRGLVQARRAQERAPRVVRVRGGLLRVRLLGGPRDAARARRDQPRREAAHLRRGALLAVRGGRGGLAAGRGLRGERRVLVRVPQRVQGGQARLLARRGDHPRELQHHRRGRHAGVGHELPALQGHVELAQRPELRRAHVEHAARAGALLAPAAPQLRGQPRRGAHRVAAPPAAALPARDGVPAARAGRA